MTERKKQFDKVFHKALVMMFTCFDIRGLSSYYIEIEKHEESPTVREVLKSLERFFLSNEEGVEE